MSDTHAPEQQLVTAATPLTTPCTLSQLRNWLKAVDAVVPGKEKTVTVSTTATTVAVA